MRYKKEDLERVSQSGSAQRRREQPEAFIQGSLRRAALAAPRDPSAKPYDHPHCAHLLRLPLNRYDGPAPLTTSPRPLRLSPAPANDSPQHTKRTDDVPQPLAAHYAPAPLLRGPGTCSPLRLPAPLTTPWGGHPTRIRHRPYRDDAPHPLRLPPRALYASTLITTTPRTATYPVPAPLAATL
uniref:Uncharacterized protein n=1 Tax=Knipowitschia caucasica TaxID=637954 RepID=A0AAV2LJC0_KNICA